MHKPARNTTVTWAVPAAVDLLKEKLV